jgi:hypothetical protein
METKEFSTRDLYLAATLITLKFPIIGIDYQIEGTKSNPVGYFKFEDTDTLQKTRLLFTQAMLTVEPKLFVTNMHSLKAEVANTFRNPKSIFAQNN